MLNLSKRIKWLAVFATACYLTGTATVPHAPSGTSRETMAVDTGGPPAPFPVFGINELTHMYAR